MFHNDTSNVWSTGSQDFSAATSLKVPTSAGAAPSVSGLIAYDSTANKFKLGVNTVTKILASEDGNVATATGLQTARTIAGISFDGTANIAISSTGLSDTAALVRNNAANTWTTGIQDLGAATSLKVPTAAGAAPTASGQIAYDSTANKFRGGANAVAKIMATEDGVPNSSYRTILLAAGSHIAGRVAGSYALGHGDPAAISGTGTLYPIATIYIAAADYPTVNAVTTKLRIRAQLYVNDVAPTGNFTFGLHPITRPATSGAAGLNIYTIGAVIAGSNGATFTAPAADLLGNAVGADFALPADGHYIIGVVTTATVAASSHIHMVASLQMRN